MATLGIKSTIKYFMVIYPCTILLGISSSCKPTPDLTVESPDKNLLVTFKLGEGGNALFQVSSRGQLVLDWSPLGIVYSDGAFSSDLELDQVSPLVSHQDDYELHHGKKSTVNYLANEQTIQLSNESGAVLGITFRVSNDGVAFQYILPESENEVIIQKELTGYNFPKQTLMYVQPMSVAKTGWQSTNPSYEEAYKQAIPVNTPSEPGAGWVYPALFEVGEDWVLITEAG
ncbi:MAG: glycoside hydrolase family 97 N-terminal domain-containing protein, partial [Marinoscillum sp.]